VNIRRIAFSGNGLRATSKQTLITVLDTQSNLITLQISETNTSQVFYSSEAWAEHGIGLSHVPMGGMDK
jgi:hypothetical protein